MSKIDKEFKVTYRYKTMQLKNLDLLRNVRLGRKYGSPSKNGAK
jgi:hypothetical protein